MTYLFILVLLLGEGEWTWPEEQRAHGIRIADHQGPLFRFFLTGVIP